MKPAPDEDDSIYDPRLTVIDGKYWMAYATSTEPMLSHLNVGAGSDITIRELAEMIADIVGFAGVIDWNKEMPDGTPQMPLDIFYSRTRDKGQRYESVVITPHVSARAELSGERRWEVLQKNIQAFGAGEPLINVVDKAKGY